MQRLESITWRAESEALYTLHSRQYDPCSCSPCLVPRPSFYAMCFKAAFNVLCSTRCVEHAASDTMRTTRWVRTSHVTGRVRVWLDGMAWKSRKKQYFRRFLNSNRKAGFCSKLTRFRPKSTYIVANSHFKNSSIYRFQISEADESRRHFRNWHHSTIV